MKIVKRGASYYLDYRYPQNRYGRRIRERVGPDREEAEILKGKRLQEMRQGINPEFRKIAPMPLKAMVKEYLERHARNLKSFKSSRLNADILVRHFGDRTLQEIGEREVLDFVNARKDAGAAEPTINRQLSCLSGIFECAIKWKLYAGENPARGTWKGKESSGLDRYLTAEEAEALIVAAPPHLKAIILCALYTGGRLSEVLTLGWKDIRGGSVYFDATNTKSGKQREIPIHPRLAEVFQARRKHRFSGGDARDSVFTWGGRRIKSVRTAYQKARKDAGLGPDVRFHTLRHTFGSWFMLNGGDLYRLQKYMGHSTIELTARYAHLSPQHRREGVAFIGAPAARGQSVDTTGQEAAESASVSA